jgi:hypothetical protein
MSWTEDPNGQRRVQFESDDPEAQALMLDLLNRTNGDSSDQAGAVS